MAAAQALLASRTAAAPGSDGAPSVTATLPAEEATAVRQAVRRAAKPLHRYRCAACGFEAEHYFWQCPGCLGWDTYPPRRLEDL
jgi:lipopolysaccharide biosynthesis regulator YciM